MLSRGRFIALEGGEGAGKSTAIHFIEQFLYKQGVESIKRVREPGGTGIAESLRTLLKSKSHDEALHPKTELLLMYAARIQLVETVIKPSLQRGEWVIGDRHALSSFAYQGIGRALGINTVNQLHQLCLHDFKPDLTLYLDVTPEIGFSRVELRGEKDRIEQEKMDFFRRIRDGYLSMVDAGKAVKIDCDGTITEVETQLADVLNEFIEKEQL